MNLEAQSQSADGRLLALNVATQMADQQAQQMQKLREIMLADMQSKVRLLRHRDPAAERSSRGCPEFLSVPAGVPLTAMDSCRDGIKGDPDENPPNLAVLCFCCPAAPASDPAASCNWPNSPVPVRFPM